MLARRREEIVGHQVSVLYSSQDSCDKSQRRLLEMIEVSGFGQLEVQFQRLDGSRLPVILSMVPFMATGSEPAYTLVVLDVSERNRTAEALKLNEERLRLAMEATQQGWFDLNVQDGTGESSPEYIQHIGYDPAQFKISVKGWFEGVHPEDRELVERTYQECLRSAESSMMEYRRRTRSGDYVWIRTMAKVVEFDAVGRPLRVAGTHVDVTERKQLEERLLHSQRLEAIGTLASGVAHDLNNILTPMLMSSGVLRERLAGPEERELLMMLESGARRGANIVRQLLTMS